jgi:hypothetical protein
MKGKKDAIQNEAEPMSKKAVETTEIPEILKNATIEVADETVNVTLPNPDDPEEKASFTIRKWRAAAFLVNDLGAKVTAVTKGIKPFEG